MWALTVAAVIERQGRFLVVEEPDKVTCLPVINQPAGHVEPGESVLDAVRREVREETGVTFTPEAIVGLYPLKADVYHKEEGRYYVGFRNPAGETGR